MDIHIGRSEVQSDVADATRVAALAALLDYEAPPWPGATLPPLGHFLCFPPTVRESNLGIDGHPKRTSDGILPAVDMPRRMWAGSQIQFLGDIPLNRRILRRSTLVAAKPKRGRTGDMLFVSVRHEIGVEGGEVAIIDDQDIVYRAAPAHQKPAVSKSEAPSIVATLSRTIIPDTVMLFRYSALTFNSHRIHYDRDYAVAVEQYPGLVVQGPLIATLLLDLLFRQEPSRSVGSFAFRAVSPLFDGQELHLDLVQTKAGADLQARGSNGVVMTATATFRR